MNHWQIFEMTTIDGPYAVHEEIEAISYVDALLEAQKRYPNRNIFVERRDEEDDEDEE